MDPPVHERLHVPDVPDALEEVAHEEEAPGPGGLEECVREADRGRARQEIVGSGGVDQVEGPELGGGGDQLVDRALLDLDPERPPLLAHHAQAVLKHAGYHALNSLRTEKGYRHWSHDITIDDTPLEAGLGFAVAFNKEGGFMGKEALLKQKEEGVKKRMVQFILDDPEPLIYHNEPIWRDDVLVGYITSGMFGFTIGRSIGMGYVKNENGATLDFVKSGIYEIEIACKRYSAQAALRPSYDPKNERIKI